MSHEPERRSARPTAGTCRPRSFPRVPHRVRPGIERRRRPDRGDGLIWNHRREVGRRGGGLAGDTVRGGPAAGLAATLDATGEETVDRGVDVADEGRYGVRQFGRRPTARRVRTRVLWAICRVPCPRTRHQSRRGDTGGTPSGAVGTSGSGSGRFRPRSPDEPSNGGPGEGRLALIPWCPRSRAMASGHSPDTGSTDGGGRR